jgi:hypothetical protein
VGTLGFYLCRSAHARIVVGRTGQQWDDAHADEQHAQDEYNDNGKWGHGVFPFSSSIYTLPGQKKFPFIM